MQQPVATAEAGPSYTGTGVETGKLGMWLFLASEVMFFAAMIGSYIVLRLGYPKHMGPWPDPSTVLDVPVLAINTCILIASSVAMALSLQAIQRGDQKRMIRFLILAMVLGATFLGIKIWDYTELIHHGFTISSSLFGTCYYTLTGFHGLHILGGLVLMGVILVQGAGGKFTAEHHVGIENTGLYWHFVDLVWSVLFVILCLI